MVGTEKNLQVWVTSPFNLLNQSIASLLAELPGLACLGQSENINRHVADQLDLVIQILLYPDDLTSLELLRQQHPTQRVLLFALEWTAAQARAALQAGAAGCLSAHMSVDAFAASLRQAARGEIALPNALQQALIRETAREQTDSDRSDIPLTSRENEVLALVADGLSNRAVAQRLYLSVRTVENHLARIYQKMGVSSRTEAAVRALQAGWISPD